MQHPVARVIGVIHHLAVTVVTEQPPARRARLEVPVRDQLAVTSTRVFNHADIIDQDLSASQQAETELPPPVGADVGLRDLPVGVGLPVGLEALIAVFPGACAFIVRARIPKLQARSAAIGIDRPGVVIVVAHLVHHIAHPVPENNAVTSP